MADHKIDAIDFYAKAATGTRQIGAGSARYHATKKPEPGATTPFTTSRLKEDFKETKKEAKDEYKQIREALSQLYERELGIAKNNYFQNTIACREQYLREKEIAKESLDAALERAKSQYEFTIEIAKDQYKTLRRETTQVVRNQTNQPSGIKSESSSERASTRVFERLDDEIRRVSEKKAEVAKL